MCDALWRSTLRQQVTMRKSWTQVYNDYFYIKSLNVVQSTLNRNIAVKTGSSVKKSWEVVAIYERDVVLPSLMPKTSLLRLKTSEWRWTPHIMHHNVSVHSLCRSVGTFTLNSHRWYCQRNHRQMAYQSIHAMGSHNNHLSVIRSKWGKRESCTSGIAINSQ